MVRFYTKRLPISGRTVIKTSWVVINVL